MNKFKYIFFDLDGTLIDTIPLILDSFNYTFLKHFGETRPEEETISYIGMPLIKHLREIYPGREEELANTYREYNHRRHDDCVGIFIGIFELIKNLYEKGIVLGVVTSKKRELAIRGLKLFDLTDYFLFVMGPEGTTRHKPDGEPLIRAMDTAGVLDKEEILYVGDSPLDIMCARNAGVRSAAVAWTYSPRHELENVGPDIFLEKPADLLKYI